MASSDNVLRAGLTTKHMDIPELLATIAYAAGPPARVIPEPVSSATQVFRAPVADFVLSITTVDDDGEQPVPGSGPRILLCLDGEVTVATGSGEVETVAQGESVFVPHTDGALTVTGHGRVVQADVP